jgi:hypothetical protein
VFELQTKPFSARSEPGRLIIRQRVRPGLQQIVFCLLALSLSAAQREIGRSGRAWRCPALRIGLAIRIHNAEIVLRVLIKIFGCDPVSACRRLTCERDISFEDLVCVAADLYVRTIAVKRLNPMRHSRTVVVLVGPVVATARAFVWSWSHDTCLIAVDIVGPLSGRSIPLAPLGRFQVGMAGFIAATALYRGHLTPERRQPRRDRGAFQPFSVLVWLTCDLSSL